MPLIAIYELFPYLLLAILALALLFHPVQGARAVLFFGFGYFLTTAIYSLGLFADYGTRFHPLVFASAITIILYHSLDITLGLLTAWVIELMLIALNVCMIWGVPIPSFTHWATTVFLNTAELLILAGNWWHGNRRILYSRFFDLDIPVGLAGHWRRLAYQKGEEG